MSRGITAVFLLVLGVGSAQSAVLNFDTSITGADMVGVKVTAIYAVGPDESDVWASTGTQLGNSGNVVIDHEGYTGGVSGSNWSLSQQGFTLGNVNGGVLYGAWTFTNPDSDITGLIIDTTDTDFMFDTANLNSVQEDNNGSGQGRYFISDDAGVVGTYSNNVQQELYKILELSGLQGGFSFMADTDKQDEDATVGVVIDTEEIINIAVPPAVISDVDDIINEQPSNPALNAYFADTDNTPATLLAVVQSLDLTDLPDVGSSEDEIELAAALQVAASLMKDTFKLVTEGKVEGNGDIEVEINRDSGEVFVELTILNENDTTSPLSFTRLLDTPLFAYNINFDFEFKTSGGTLDVFLNDNKLLTFDATNFAAKDTASIFIDDEQFFGLSKAALRYDLYPGSPATAVLSNINFTIVQPSVLVPEPLPILVLISGLLGIVMIRKKVAGK